MTKPTLIFGQWMDELMQPLSFYGFVSQMHRPWYVYNMARGIKPEHTTLAKSASTRMHNAQREIDELVLQRAEEILRERSKETE